jgi:hypothetical protein
MTIEGVLGHKDIPLDQFLNNMITANWKTMRVKITKNQARLLRRKKEREIGQLLDLADRIKEKEAGS